MGRRPKKPESFELWIRLRHVTRRLQAGGFAIISRWSAQRRRATTGGSHYGESTFLNDGKQARILAMPRRESLAQLRSAAPAVLPSLLLCDFGNLEREVGRLTEAGVKALHLDVMDGQFVPNLTYGMPIVAAIRRLTDLPLDVHLMIAEPQRYVRQFVEAGADIVTIHIEAVSDPRPIVAEIRALGAGAGLALNPDTPLSTLDGCLESCDLVLVMSVAAGFGGQSFRPIALDKLRTLRTSIPAETLLEVDGGIQQQTIGSCAEAGAQLLVVGSAIFRASSYSGAVRELTQLAVGSRSA